MNLSRPARRPKINSISSNKKKSKFEAYFPCFHKLNSKQPEKNKRKSISRKNRCESVQSTRTYHKRSTTPVLNQKENQNSGHYYNYSEVEEKTINSIRNQKNQKSPKSFIVKTREKSKCPDLSYDQSKVFGNRSISSFSRRSGGRTKENLQDLSKYFEEFYEKSRVLLQKFEQNMKKGKLLNVG